MFTDTFAGIAPSSAPGFIGMDVLGAAVGVAIVLALYPDAGGRAGDVVISYTMAEAKHPPPERQGHPLMHVIAQRWPLKPDCASH